MQQRDVFVLFGPTFIIGVGIGVVVVVIYRFWISLFSATSFPRYLLFSPREASWSGKKRPHANEVVFSVLCCQFLSFKFPVSLGTN